MSSLDIASLTSKAHRNVMRDIKAVLAEAGIDALKFERVYQGRNGQPRPCYHLPRFECDLVISGYSVPYRAAIIRRWHALETAAREACDPASAVSWLVERMLKAMPARQFLSMLSVRHPYGSIAGNGKPRTGWRGPAYVAARHRTGDARVFDQSLMRLNVTVQLELPHLAGPSGTEGGAP